MKPTEHDITLMERYFDSELSVEEMATFSARLQHDEIFRSLVEREKIIIGAIRNQGLLDNLHYLKSVEEKIQGNHAHPSVARVRTWYYYAAAAVVALLIAVKVLLPAQQTSDELFAEYFTPYPNVFEPTMRGTDMTTKRTEAFQAYEQKNYKQAAIAFQRTTGSKKGIRNIIPAWQYKLNVGTSHRGQGKFRYFN